MQEIHEEGRLELVETRVLMVCNTVDTAHDLDHSVSQRLGP